MILILIVFFCVFVITLLCVGFGLAFLETRQRKQVRLMLHTAKPVGEIASAPLVRAAEREDSLAVWLNRFPPAVKLEVLLQQSLLEWTSGRFAALSLLGGVAGAVLGWRLRLFTMSAGSAGALAAIGLVLPLFYVLRKRKKALHAFDKQFPDALDFLSRSMRAGHGFGISIEMLGQDAPEPLASGFRRVSHELQLGSPMNTALGKMIAQVPLVDVRFFVSTVLLQQESGGNLSEILNKLANLIRERFQLKGQVKAMSAHGRITGMVLLLMPIAVTLILLATTPDYLATLTGDPHGRMMLYGAVGGQIVGYFVIKKIVNIKV